MGSEVKMSKYEWGSKLLTILNTVGTLFKSERRRKQPAIANRNSRIQLIKIKKRGILWADLPLALVVVIAGSMVSKAGAIFPESVKVGRQPNGSVSTASMLTNSP